MKRFSLAARLTGCLLSTTDSFSELSSSLDESCCQNLDIFFCAVAKRRNWQCVVLQRISKNERRLEFIPKSHGMAEGPTRSHTTWGDTGRHTQLRTQKFTQKRQVWESLRDLPGRGAVEQRNNQLHLTDDKHMILCSDFTIHYSSTLGTGFRKCPCSGMMGIINLCLMAASSGLRGTNEKFNNKMDNTILDSRMERN